jgi:hypothetical protein
MAGARAPDLEAGIARLGDIELRAVRGLAPLLSS